MNPTPRMRPKSSRRKPSKWRLPSKAPKRRVPWKLIGMAGVAGVAATGGVVARKCRAHAEYEPDELRERLRSRLAEVDQPPPPPQP